MVILQDFSLKKTSVKEEYGKSSQELSKGFFDLPESICKKRASCRCR